MPRVRVRENYKAYLEPDSQDSYSAQVPRCTCWRKTKGNHAGVQFKATVEDGEVFPANPADHNVRGQDVDDLEEVDVNVNLVGCEVEKDDVPSFTLNFAEVHVRGQDVDDLEEVDVSVNPVGCEVEKVDVPSFTVNSAEVYDSKAPSEFSESVENSSFSDDTYYVHLLSASCDSEDGSDDSSKSETGDQDSSGDFYDFILWKSRKQLLSVVSAGEIFLMAIVFSVRHSLPYLAIIDLLKLVDTIFGEAVVPGSKFLFDKICY
ncbi:uncharacterized protein LOC124172398 [Ischnura elegans]|uniref:uncharacterized protein LOC124172398 n=1 Tax=Ischnura elegans TaxID=197161 RepID=UPI001ED89BE1|nr:uncharacterized protein LOC124172398 [Ischnura elegans]